VTPYNFVRHVSVLCSDLELFTKLYGITSPKQLLSHSAKFLPVTTNQSSAVIWSSSDYRDSQEDPTFVSVSFSDFTKVKLRSAVCSFLKTQFDSNEIDCVVMSGPTCWHTFCISKYNRLALQNFVVKL